MAEALALAALGRDSAAPNPRVGCVVVRDGALLGQGWHRAAGEPHAEVLALAQCGARARGATVYVNLEPCAHHNRTAPCADALIAAAVGRVVVATLDPNRHVNGRGLARLAAAGVAVSVGCQAAAADRLNAGFFRRQRVGMPWLRAKLAMSLDGRTAMASGQSQWITGAAARADAQRLRARSCALLTGVGTVLADDPRLTVRGVGPRSRQPLRAVMDSAARTPPHARLWATGGEVVLFTAGAAPGAHCQPMPDGAGQVSPAGALRWLAEQRECNEVLLEAGATLCGAFLRESLIDELVIYAAPVLLGASAKPLFDWQVDALADGMRLDVRTVRPLGRDWRIVAAPRTDAAGG